MQAAYLHSQGRIGDPSVTGVGSSFGMDGSHLVNNAGFNAAWQTNPHMRVPFATSTNTSLAKMMTRVLGVIARETVTISPDNPWLGRLCPAVPTPELKVQKNVLDIVRNIAPYAPHFSAPRKQRIRTMTRIRQQTRKSWGAKIEKTMLFQAEGRNYLTALFRGVRENIAGTLIYEAQMEFLQSAQDYQKENYKFGNNPYENMHGMQGVSQGNAIMAYSQIRRDMFAALSKSGDQFRAVLDRIQTMMREHRNANPDVLIAGPGIKARLALGDPSNSKYYIAGNAGEFLRINGERRVDTYLGLDIVETLAVNPDEDIRSTFTREVEVGEFNLLTRSKNSSGADFKPYHRNIRIYNQSTDSMEVISMADVVRNAPDFDRDGLSPFVYDLAREYNSGARTHYQRVHHLSREIDPSTLSLFIYPDGENRAHVASVWGQVSGLGGTAGIKQTIDSMLGAANMTRADLAEISAAIEDGKNLLDEIKDLPLAGDSFDNKGTDAQKDRTLRNEANVVADAAGNSAGSLDFTGVGSLVGYANGAGIITISKADAANVGDDNKRRAKAFVDAVTKLISQVGRVLKSKEALRATTPAWFHKPTAVSAFIDLIAGVQLPVWLSIPSTAPTGTAGRFAAAKPDFTGVDASDFKAVSDALKTATVPASTTTPAALAALDTEITRIQQELIQIVSTSSGQDALEAIELLQEIATVTGANRGRLAGLGAISYRSALIMQEKGVATVPGFFGLVSHMLRIEDLSPASYMAIGTDSAMSSAEHLIRMAAALSKLTPTQAQAWIAEGVEAKNQGDNDATLKKWWKKAPKKVETALRILDSYNYAVAAPTTEDHSAFVRTGLTLSKSQLKTKIAAPMANGFRVSNPDAPWTPLTTATNVNLDKNPFVAGGDGIGGQLEMHEHAFFTNLLENVSEDFSHIASRKRIREFDSDDEEDDYGFGGIAHSSSRSRGLGNLDDILLAPRRSGSDVEGMDLVGASSSSAPIGARFPGSRATREQYNLQPLGMGRKFHKAASPSMQDNYASAMSLGSTMFQTLALTFLLLPVNLDTALALAQTADAPFGGLIARPHIRHLMATAMVVESGPSTAMTHFTETDVASTANDTKEWTYNITWQSTAFVHNPQWTEIFHDCLCLSYSGGNDTTFFKRESDEFGYARVYDPVNGAQASIYAFIIGAYEVPPNPLNLTGVHHITGYDNNVKGSDIPVPHYTGAPLAEKVWGFSKLAKMMHHGEGLVDQLANTMCYVGLTDIHTGSNVINDYVVGQENTGHLGRTKPNEGLANVRAGSAII